MAEQRSKFNNLAITILMCLIIVAFLFTGVQSFTNNSNQVASIDDKVVSPTEFNRALQANLEDLSKRNGGKYPTQKQIRDLGIQDSIIEQLISQKILLRFAENLDFGAGKEAIKDAIITQYAAFKTNNQFDITKYKNILKLNGIQVKDFESDVIDQIKVNKLNSLLAALQPSEKYLAEQMKLRNTEATVSAISFEKEAMTKNINVSSTEIAEFFKDKVKSGAVISSLYKVYSEGKKAGSRKSEKEMSNQLAKEHIQKTKREELTTLNAKVKKELLGAFEGNNWNEVERLAKKYKLNFKKSQTVNLLTPNIPGISTDRDKLTSALASKNTSDVLVEDSALSVSLVKINKFKTKETKKDDPFAQFAKYSQSRAMRFKAIDYQRGKSSIKKYNIVLQ